MEFTASGVPPYEYHGEDALLETAPYQNEHKLSLK